MADLSTPCRRMETRSCPVGNDAPYDGPCGDRPCARFDLGAAEYVHLARKRTGFDWSPIIAEALRWEPQP